MLCLQVRLTLSGPYMAHNRGLWVLVMFCGEADLKCRVKTADTWNICFEMGRPMQEMPAGREAAVIDFTGAV